MKAFLCNQCGAQLEVTDTTKFVKWQFCGTSLRIFEKNGTVLSEEIEALKERQDATDTQVEILKLENRHFKLEKSWDRAKAAFTQYNKDGTPYLPDEHSSFFAYFLGIPFFLIIAIALTAGSPLEFNLVVIPILVIGGVILSLNLKRKAAMKNEYLAAKRRYFRKRAEIEEQIARLRRAART